ncbi:hypothetical protein NC651_001745 [Populus alba x Populus x berolinensis]|nr:hypothetical protein NC651_001745 [Populus alba x Populus x berolinensis]
MWCWLIGGCPVHSSSFMYHQLIFRGSEQVEFFGKIWCSSRLNSQVSQPECFHTVSMLMPDTFQGRDPSQTESPARYDKNWDLFKLITLQSGTNPSSTQIDGFLFDNEMN